MSDYGHEQTDKELKRVENLISKEYAQAAEELEKKMMKHFSDFSRKDAEKQKELKSGIITEQRYNEWKIGQLAIGQRWKDARDSMTDILVNADKNAAAIIQGNNIKAYGDNMNYGTYEVEHGSEINTGFTLYDEETVRNLLKEDPKLIPMPKVDIPKDELWNRQKLTSAVTQGILQGESIDKIAKRLGQVADMDKNAAIRNARTYTTAAENKGRIDSYERAEKLGIKTNKKWIATLDDRTRVEHRHLDNMVVAYDEDFEVDGYKISYPGDPSAEPEMIYNCRCTLVADIVGYPYNDERNDDKLGDMTYEEWKHAKDRQMEQPKEEKRITKPYIPENIRKEIDRFEDKFKNANKENYMAIDKDGNVIFESSGKERKVTVPKYVDEQMEGGYSIHNHTADATFSSADISNYEKYGEHGIITDINGYESILYNTNPVAIFREVAKAETNEEYERLMPFSTAAHKIFTEIDNDITERRREYSKELMQMESDSVKRAKMLNEWMQENNPEIRKREWLEENAEKYGFIFERRKIGN